MNNTISKCDFITLLEDTIDSGKDFSFTPTGTSMLPMLNGTTDTVMLTKKPSRLKKYDVALYIRRRDNALVLHRVVKLSGDSYTMSGDSQYYYDYDIAHNDVLAVMKSFTRASKCYTSSSFSYQCYIKIMLIKKYTRIFISKVYHKLFK